MRQHLIDVWTGVEQIIIGDGIDQWRSEAAFELQEDILTIHCDIYQSKRC